MTQPIPGPIESQQQHRRADTDASQTAIHHTLGYRPNQAAPGDHTHNGIDSRPLGLENYLTKAEADSTYVNQTDFRDLATEFHTEAPVTSVPVAEADETLYWMET